MADLSIDFCGIKAPNPFWLSSSPSSRTAEMVIRAFEIGWGGVIWKSIVLKEKKGDLIINVSPCLTSINFMTIGFTHHISPDIIGRSIK